MKASRLVNVLMTVLFFFSLFQLSGIFIDYYRNSQALAEARTLYEGSADEDNPQAALSRTGDTVSGVSFNAAQAEAVPDVRSPFIDLLQVNRDVVGWIKIDDTRISYPILQTMNNDYYLNRNYKRENARSGSIFMDFRNAIIAPDPNTVIYGHRMKDGSMFGDLKKFLNKDFYNRHRTFTFDTLYQSYRAEIFSVYYTTTDFNYIQTEFDSEDEYRSFLQTIQEKSLYKSDTALTAEDRIVTLSTCDYTLDQVDGRLVVHAKLVEKDDDEAPIYRQDE
ncbi:class B sortase [Paenibacillus naphthalenovorans]|uniref:class B sortase n=1 Tax=Paenibacillus naphthalenovorans TaxID=162209 RepID=UPI003D2AA4C2